jgi:tight adherence protein C
MSVAALLIAFFVVTAAAVAGAGYVFVLRPARTEASEVSTATAHVVLSQPDLPIAQAAVLDMFRLIGEAVPGGGGQQAAARALLSAAGFRWPAAVSVFLGIKCGMALMFGTAAAWAGVTFQPDSSILFLPALAGLGFGYLLPDRVLERLAARRVHQLRRGLPAAIDLMVLAVEAGQSLDAAILEASRGLRVTHPELASELTQLHHELRANPSRVEALQNFGARGRDIELKKFTGLLIDTDRFGTSLGPALRTHARYLRTRFRQAAQEKARKVGVKLIFPVFFLIFPSVILVTLGPAVILLFAQMHALLAQ